MSRFVPKAVTAAAVASHALSTPKRFLDDHRIGKYTSPELRTMSEQAFEPATNSDFGSLGSGIGGIGGMNGGADDSRRYSIDSFSRGNSTVTVSLPQFNRFNTISENEFEEPDINQKSLELEMNGNLNRLSILQTRNQRAPPHLKSSYALEMNLPTSNELDVKENRAPLLASSSSKTNLSNLGSSNSGSNLNLNSNGNGNNSKRRYDDSRATDTNSPPRKTSTSHMVGILPLAVDFGS